MQWSHMLRYLHLWQGHMYDLHGPDLLIPWSHLLWRDLHGSDLHVDLSDDL